MKHAKLLRGSSENEGMFGMVQAGDLLLHTLELPWRDNQTGKSCIPRGVYVCEWKESPSKGWCYHLTGTEPREHILIHPANFGGDVDAGWETELLGCIAMGRNIGTLVNHRGKIQQALLGSKKAVEAFNSWGAKDPITLTIE